MKKATIPEYDPLIQAMDSTMSRYCMVRPGDCVLVGFSGGGDSTALLLGLHCLASKRSLHIGAAHLNHGLRGARAASDARRAAGAAEKLGIPFYSETRPVEAYRKRRRLSLEEAAREVRYRFLEDVARRQGFSHIALGHHQGDDAELMLMRFLRISGPRGLSGMPPKRPSKDKDLTIIRPLLRMPRRAIEAFLSRYAITQVEDESNTDLQILRNRIRHQLLPLLKAEYNPSIEAGLGRMSELMRDEEDWLADLVADKLRGITLRRERNLLVLDRQVLVDCHPALQRRLLRSAVERCKGDLRRIGFASLEGARELAVQDSSHGSYDLPAGLQVRVRDNRLEIRHQNPSKRPGRHIQPNARRIEFRFEIPGPGRYFIQETGVTLDFAVFKASPDPGNMASTGQQTAFFDMDQLCFPLIIRNCNPGDRMAPLGLNGTQKVKKIFIDRKVDREERPRYPVLIHDETILWIGGLRQSEVGKLTTATKRVLKVEMTGCLSAQDD